MEPTTTEPDLLFIQYLNVCNAALDTHRERFPYKQLVDAAERLLADRHLGIELYKEDPSRPFDYFTVQFRDGRLDLVKHGKDSPDVAWKVSRRYLERVVANEQTYIEHPARLDWDWLKSRLGVG